MLLSHFPQRDARAKSSLMFQRCRNIWSWVFIERALGVPCMRKAFQLPSGTLQLFSVSVVAKGSDPWWTSVASGHLRALCHWMSAAVTHRAPPAHLQVTPSWGMGTPLRDGATQSPSDFSLESIKLRIVYATKPCLKNSIENLSFLNFHSVIWHGINACQRNLETESNFSSVFVVQLKGETLSLWTRLTTQLVLVRHHFQSRGGSEV